MESVLCCIQMEEYLRGVGRIILSMVKDTRNSRMGQSTTALTQMVNHKDMELIHGTMVRHMRVNGSMGKSMGLESGEAHKVILISVSGNKTKHLVMGYILGSMVIDTRENFKIA